MPRRLGHTRRSCDLRVEDSWLGIGPTAYGALALNSNVLAMDLDTTRFEIVNTSFVRNAPRTGVAFAGITLRNTLGAAQPGRIVHSTFMRHDMPSASKALAIDCTYAVAGSITILNSLFVNDVAPSGGNTYVAPNCKSGNVLYNGSDDTTLTGTGSFTDLGGKYADLFVGTGLSNSAYNPRIKPTAASLVRRGTTAYTDSQGALTLPAVDSEGRARPSSNVAVGAFEPAQ